MADGVGYSGKCMVSAGVPEVRGRHIRQVLTLAEAWTVRLAVVHFDLDPARDFRLKRATPESRKREAARMPVNGDSREFGVA